MSNKITKARNLKVGMTVLFNPAADVRRPGSALGEKRFIKINDKFKLTDPLEELDILHFVQSEGVDFWLRQDDDVEVLIDMAVAKDDFGWLGEPVEVFEVGRDYCIVEYLVRNFETKELTTESNFSPYVLGKKISESVGSLDAALALCIAYKHEGPNHAADFYFMKSIKG